MSVYWAIDKALRRLPAWGTGSGGEPALSAKPMVFEDPTSRRWHQARRVVASAGVFTVAFLASTVAERSVSPFLPEVPAAADTLTHPDFISRPLIKEKDLTNYVATASTATGVAAPALGTLSDQRPRLGSLAELGSLRSAWIVQEDETSVESLRTHVNSLQVVYPDWMTFTDASGQFTVKIDPDVADILAKSHAHVFPRISNTFASGEWFSEGISTLFNDPVISATFISKLTDELLREHADGINIDIEGLSETDRDAYTVWLGRLTAAMHAHGLLVTVDLPMGEIGYDNKGIGEAVDAVVLMAYDEHWQTSPAGPVAGQAWFVNGLRDTLRQIPASKMIVGIGAYGYDWTDGKPMADAIDFQNAMLRADHYHAKVAFDPISRNSHYDYIDAAGAQHHVWLMDAISAWNEVSIAMKANVLGVAVWRTGMEEERFWSFYGKPAGQDFDPATLASIDPPQLVVYDGTGVMLRVRTQAEGGTRKISQDQAGISGADVVTIPKAYEVERFQRATGKQIAFTFDDGPDPEWTPRILAVLAKYKVPATFFVVGQQTEKFPDIVAGAYKSGHIIGNHTSTHPLLPALTPSAVERELNLAQRQIEAATGHSTILFRAPYSADVTFSYSDDLRPLYDVTRLGYVVGAADVDPKDFGLVSTDHIVRKVLSSVEDGKPHVVVLHDAGGNRSHTVDALDRLIPQLTAMGYDIVGLDKFLGMPAALVMPPPTGAENTLLTMRHTLSMLTTAGNRILFGLLFSAIAIGVLRLAALSILVFVSVKRPRPHVDAAFLPPVRVLVPAHNEQDVIGRTLEMLLASDYPQLSVTVIDDGSKDRTADIVRDWMARDARVSLITQANSGKAGALNRGFTESFEDIIVTVDADTIVRPQTVRKLVEPMADPAIDAVCGNVQVGNVRNLLTGFQNVEYITSQNFDRRAFDLLNCIWVVPGATGAWRRSKVLSVGGYSYDTLTEDTDLTQSVLAKGGRITIAPEAVSVTEAPETIRALYTQRFRWTYGTLQSVWKHRRSLGRGSVGLIALPNMLLFQFLLPLLAPIGDGILLLSLVRQELSVIALSYLAFLVMDLVGSALAFRLDGKPLQGLWVVLLQRFFYRQFMYVVTFAALFAAIRGRRHGWNKLIRTGAAQGPVGVTLPV